MARRVKKTNKRITSGGSYTPGTDIVLSAPQLFYFDIDRYISSVIAASSIDFSRRSQLYDMYESAFLDLHLGGVMAKRLRGVTRLSIEFQRNGVPDEELNRQLASPWMKSLRKDIIMAEFWGYSLFQFYRDEEGLLRYDLIPRKHYNPISRKLLRRQYDTDGVDIDAYDNMLFVGEERSLGVLAELMPAILYKRNNIGDWAKFCEIFGIPIRKYTYNAGDENTRDRLLRDAYEQGVGAVYITPEESSLEIVEAGNKAGSSQLYKDFTDYWDRAISIRVLGNTLTTDASATGTQALGTIHKEVEEELNEDDCATILDVLNYHLKPILEALGFHVSDGDFVYAVKEKHDPLQRAELYLKAKQLGLPLDDDEMYETMNIKKPDNYEEQRAQLAEQRAALTEQLEGNQEDKDEEERKEKRKLKARLSRFFGLALGDTAEGSDF